ncbi:cytochrome P450 [Micromonosporaceae bacterium B7E4]
MAGSDTTRGLATGAPPGGSLPPAVAAASLLTPAGRANPYPSYEAIRAHGPVVPLGERYAIAVGYPECVQILRDRGMIVHDEGVMTAQGIAWRTRTSLVQVARSMVNMNGPGHARLRRLVSAAFTPRRIDALGPAVEQHTDELCDRLAERGAGRAVDFMAEFAFRLPVTVVGDLLGVPPDDHGLIRDAVIDLVRAYDSVEARSDFGPADAARDRLADYFADLVGARRARPTDDLTSALVTPGDGDRLSEEDLVANLILLLLAGFESTSNLLGNAVSLLLDHPEHAARLRTDEAFAAGFVEETLRFESPVQSTVRRAGTDVTVAGRTLAAGTDVKVLIGAAQRDPRRFPDPARFDPCRADQQSLSFGAGAHFCLGAGLARLEARTALSALSRRFPHLTRAGAAVMRNSLVLRGHDQLPVDLER